MLQYAGVEILFWPGITFQFSIGDDLATAERTWLRNGKFQFSIGDAEVFVLSNALPNATTGFNSLLEMPGQPGGLSLPSAPGGRFQFSIGDAY